MSAKLSNEEIQRYSRHLLIPEVGLKGQQMLKDARVLVVGTGGLGSPAAMYLAAAGIGRIGLVDYDVVDRSNLQRQVIHGTSTLGQQKVVSARQRMLDINPDIRVDVFPTPFCSENAEDISRDYDLIIDGTDNFPTRYLINDLCVLTGKPYVYGSIFRFEGQVSVFDAKRGPCYRCLFPEPPPPDSVPSCAQAGVFGILPGTIGTIQATEAIKLILGIGEPLIGTLLLYDALSMQFQAVKIPKNPGCKICGAHPTLTSLIDYEEFCGVSAHTAPNGSAGAEWDIEPSALARWLSSEHPPRLIDVREAVELDISHIEGSKNIPWDELPERISELDKTEDIVLFCRTGERSARALKTLTATGFRKVKNLRGGINAWVEAIDPGQPVY